jgi:hypothetical protein
MISCCCCCCFFPHSRGSVDHPGPFEPTQRGSQSGQDSAYTQTAEISFRREQFNIQQHHGQSKFLFFLNSSWNFFNFNFYSILWLQNRHQDSTLTKAMERQIIKEAVLEKTDADFDAVRFQL